MRWLTPAEIDAAIKLYNGSMTSARSERRYVQL